MFPASQTELEFDNFFYSLGYSRVSEDAGNSPMFKNADYVDKNNKIIVELKILEKEHFSNGGVIDSLLTLIIQPDIIDENGFGTYSFSIPKQNRKNRHDSFEEPLKQVLKKANRQLRETKSFYSDNGVYSGYVIIAQTGLESLPLEITAQLTSHILNHDFSEIDGVVICSPHQTLMNPITRKVNGECISITKDWDFLLSQQCKSIADQWCHFLENGGHSRLS